LKGIPAHDPNAAELLSMTHGVKPIKFNILS